MRRYSIILAVRSTHDANALLPGREFLMLRSRKRGDKWELPGGQIEPGETPESGALRELLEETGHDWKRAVLVQRRNTGLGEGYVFLCELGPRRQAPEASTTGLGFHARLPPREHLSFPDDPYDDLFAAAQRHLAKPQAEPARP